MLIHFTFLFKSLYGIGEAVENLVYITSN